MQHSRKRVARACTSMAREYVPEAQTDLGYVNVMRRRRPEAIAGRVSFSLKHDSHKASPVARIYSTR